MQKKYFNTKLLNSQGRSKQVLQQKCQSQSTEFRMSKLKCRYERNKCKKFKAKVPEPKYNSVQISKSKCLKKEKKLV